jgi:hypothetical protein
MEAPGQLHALTALPSVKEALLPVEQEAGWTPKSVWMVGRTEQLLAPARTQTRE